MILTILEVSQKQAYIFASNKLADNITNSAVIAHVLSKKYLKKVLKGHPYNTEKNMVYSGGGHTVLVFEAENDDMAMEQAKECVQVITESVYRDFDGLNIFASSIVYKEEMYEKAGDAMKALTEALEKKKAERKAAFRHGSFGIEKIDATTLAPKCLDKKSAEKKALSKDEEENEKSFWDNEYSPVKEFKYLGGSKNESNFIAVVHIDGNGMGTRVNNIYSNPKYKTWEKLREALKLFSDEIDKHFKEALKEMGDEVAEVLHTNKEFKDALNLQGKKFPVRRLITAGDDICFVTEGRIGIECAVAFMKALSKKVNPADGQGYSSCAGVAIVHQKYPFYKAYDLAEKLCSNAKKFNAQIHPADNGTTLSSIDWHIEFGEIGDTLEEIRKDYTTMDGNRLELRPYIVVADSATLEQHPAHSYENFYRFMVNLKEKESKYANGKVKELRAVLKEGKSMTKYYLTFNHMNDLLYDTKNKEKVDFSKAFSGQKTEKAVFVPDHDEKEHSILFDAIELMDTFLIMEKKEEAV